MRKIIATTLCLVLVLGIFTACGGADAAVTVQSVAQILGYGSLGLHDSYAGIVEAGQTVDLEKDATMEVSEVLVKAGDEVTAGQVLFTYDTEELTLERDKAVLELEQSKSSVTTMQEQIAALEKEKQYASASAQLDYTLQIQALQLNVQETELNTSAKQKEIDRLNALLENTEVLSPVSGTVQSVNASGATDDYGNPLPFLSISEAGNFRIKGSINEQQISGIYEGMEITVHSRLDDSSWHGYISYIDYEHPENNIMEYYGAADMSGSSNYPFYIDLEDDSGLMLGQHVYFESYLPESGAEGLMLPAEYIVDGSYVWAAKKGKLERRKISVGSFDELTGTYEIIGGLSLEDYIAFPDKTCVEGAKTVVYDPTASAEGGDIPEGGYDEGYAGEGFYDEGYADEGFYDVPVEEEIVGEVMEGEG